MTKLTAVCLQGRSHLCLYMSPVLHPIMRCLFQTAQWTQMHSCLQTSLTTASQPESLQAFLKAPHLSRCRGTPSPGWMRQGSRPPHSILCNSCWTFSPTLRVLVSCVTLFPPKIEHPRVGTLSHTQLSSLESSPKSGY